MKPPSELAAAGSSLVKLSDPALLELMAALEQRVLSGAASLDEYGQLARCHQEWARRHKGV